MILTGTAAVTVRVAGSVAVEPTVLVNTARYSWWSRAAEAVNG